jgi:hypothetical protein
VGRFRRGVSLKLLKRIKLQRRISINGTNSTYLILDMDMDIYLLFSSSISQLISNAWVPAKFLSTEATMNVIPFYWQPYNDATVSYYATEGFPWKLRYQTMLEGELPTGNGIRSIRFNIAMNRFQVIHFGGTGVTATHAITSVLRYMNKPDEMGLRRGDLLHSHYAYIYDFHVNALGGAQLWLSPHAVYPIVTISDSDSDSE